MSENWKKYEAVMKWKFNNGQIMWSRFHAMLIANSIVLVALGQLVIKLIAGNDQDSIPELSLK